MKVFRLARAAYEAETLRLRYVARRFARRIALGVFAGLFGLFALAALHVVAFMVLAHDAGIAPAWSAAIVAGADLLIVVICLLLALIGRQGAVEIEARIMRDRSIAELRTSLALASVTGPVARAAGRGAFGVARRAFSRRRGRSRG